MVVKGVLDEVARGQCVGEDGKRCDGYLVLDPLLHPLRVGKGRGRAAIPQQEGVYTSVCVASVW